MIENLKFLFLLRHFALPWLMGLVIKALQNEWRDVGGGEGASSRNASQLPPVFTALRGMQTRSSVCASVRPSNAWIL